MATHLISLGLLLPAGTNRRASGLADSGIAAVGVLEDRPGDVGGGRAVGEGDASTALAAVGRASYGARHRSDNSAARQQAGDSAAAADRRSRRVCDVLDGRMCAGG